MAVLLVAAGVATAVPRAVWGQDAPPPAATPIRLVVVSDGPGLDPGRLRDHLTVELQEPVALHEDFGQAPDAGIVTVVYRSAQNQLTVSYLPPGGDSVSRTVSPSLTPDGVAALAVLLAGNVVRNQAAELLGPATTTEAPPPAPPPTATAVVTPAPPPAAARPYAIHPAVWSSTGSYVNAGVKLSGRHAYAWLSASGHWQDWLTLFGPGLALGLSLPCFGLACDADLGATYLFATGSAPAAERASILFDGLPTPVASNRLVSRLRTSVAYSFRPRFTAFAGAALALTAFKDAGYQQYDFGPELFVGFGL